MASNTVLNMRMMGKRMWKFIENLMKNNHLRQVQPNTKLHEMELVVRTTDLFFLITPN